MTEVWLEMKMPIFVARQFVRHRTVSLNEVSARYVQLPADFYIPDPKTVGVKGKTQKQGREIVDAENIQAIKFCKQLADESNRAYKNYEEALSSGIPNELARCYLPLNIYTSWLWHQDLHNMIHFLKLRLHSHTQYESRQYAEAIYTLLKSVLPYTMELFDKYNRVEK
jgi:thymidylate synthase (FAD)